MLIIFQQFLCVKGKPAKLVQTLQFCTKMDESGDFWRSVTTEMTVRHNKCEPAPPTAFQSVLAVAAAVMQRGTPQKKKPYRKIR